MRYQQDIIFTHNFTISPKINLFVQNKFLIISSYLLFCYSTDKIRIIYCLNLREWMGDPMKFEQITLFTSNFSETMQFYDEILECPMLEVNIDYFKVKIGETTLCFQRTKDNIQPYYHFAIDIPYNYFYEMKQHFQNILFLLMEDGKHSVYCESFVAQSMYFNDPSGNIVELIARASNITDEPEFTRVSEMSFVCNDLDTLYPALLNYNVTVHNGEPFNSNQLNFIGDMNDESYLLLTPEQRKWLFSDKLSQAHPLTIRTDQFELSYAIDNNWILEPVSK